MTSALYVVNGAIKKEIFITEYSNECPYLVLSKQLKQDENESFFLLENFTRWRMDVVAGDEIRARAPDGYHAHEILPTGGKHLPSIVINPVLSFK